MTTTEAQRVWGDITFQSIQNTVTKKIDLNVVNATVPEHILVGADVVHEAFETPTEQLYGETDYDAVQLMLVINARNRQLRYRLIGPHDLGRTVEAVLMADSNRA